MSKNVWLTGTARFVACDAERLPSGLGLDEAHQVLRQHLHGGEQMCSAARRALALLLGAADVGRCDVPRVEVTVSMAHHLMRAHGTCVTSACPVRQIALAKLCDEGDYRLDESHRGVTRTVRWPR